MLAKRRVTLYKDLLTIIPTHKHTSNAISLPTNTQKNNLNLSTHSQPIASTTTKSRTPPCTQTKRIKTILISLTK